MPTSYTYHKSIICVCQFLYWNIYKFYALRSLPQFLISVILACPESFPESFRDRKDSRQAGMTLKTNIQFLTPCGLLPQGSSHCLGIRILLYSLLCILLSVFCYRNYIRNPSLKEFNGLFDNRLSNHSFLKVFFRYSLFFYCLYLYPDCCPDFLRKYLFEQSQIFSDGVCKDRIASIQDDLQLFACKFILSQCKLSGKRCLHLLDSPFPEILFFGFRFR